MNIVKPTNMTIKIDWTEIKNMCRATMGKSDTNVEATSKFKKKLLIAEHSPIREGWVKWTWDGIKSWISVHFARHWLGWNKYISTQRDDRTELFILKGNSRDEAPQNTPVLMKVSADMQALINVSRVRLCYQASPETREHMEQLKISIKNDGNEPELYGVMVPNCVYRGGCPEFAMCKEQVWVNFLRWSEENNKSINTIEKRYDAYNEWFYLNKERE